MKNKLKKYDYLLKNFNLYFLHEYPNHLSLFQRIKRSLSLVEILRKEIEKKTIIIK